MWETPKRPHAHKAARHVNVYPMCACTHTHICRRNCMQYAACGHLHAHAHVGVKDLLTYTLHLALHAQAVQLVQGAAQRVQP